MHTHDCVCARSPVLGGEVFAVDRHFFQRVGGFDPGMLLWGEEQIELSIRVKQIFFCHQPAFESQPRH